LFSRGKYSHASVVLQDGSVIESAPFKGVVRYPNIQATAKKDQLIDLYSVKSTVKQYKTIVAFLESKIGCKYDYLSVFGFVVFSNRQGRKARDKWFCDELIIAAFNQAKIHLVGKMPAWKASPTTISYYPKLIVDKTIRIN
jgi:uncharacterized protein YycO